MRVKRTTLKRSGLNNKVFLLVLAGLTLFIILLSVNRSGSDVAKTKAFSQQIASPTYVCGGSVNCAGSPTVTIPVGGGTTGPGVTAGATAAVTFAPTTDPCQTTVAHYDRENKPKKGKNGGGFFQGILDFLKKLIELLIQLLTGKAPDNSAPNGNEIAPTVQPTISKEPTVGPGGVTQVPTVPPCPSTSPAATGGVPTTAPTAPVSGTPGAMGKYLIVTDPSFSSAMGEFVTFRKNQGFDVSMVGTDTTGKTTDSIKQYIQTQYDNAATQPKYLLLVGNVSFIPTWTIGSVRGDIPYAQLAGSDTLPDLSVGRWPVSTAQHVANITKKTIAVETTACPAQKEALFLASEDVKETTQPGQDEACTLMQAHGFTCNKRYPNGTTQQAIDDINRGQLFVWFIGHGGTDGWSDGPEISSSDISKLTNTVYPVVGSFTCNSCDLPESAELNFCDVWTQSTGGSAAFIGASWSTPWEEEVYFEHNMIKAMYAGTDRIGPILDFAKKENVAKYPGSMGDKYLNGYNLMGDPALKVPACP